MPNLIPVHAFIPFVFILQHALLKIVTAVKAEQHAINERLLHDFNMKVTPSFVSYKPLFPNRPFARIVETFDLNPVGGDRYLATRKQVTADYLFCFTAQPASHLIHAMIPQSNWYRLYPFSHHFFGHSVFLKPA